MNSSASKLESDIKLKQSISHFIPSVKKIRFLVTLSFAICLGTYIYIYYYNIQVSFLKFSLISHENRLGKAYIGFGGNISELDQKSQAGCSPFKIKDEQHKVLIDGVEYPQHIPIHFSRKIDFECLNKKAAEKKKHKLILFWNKFYGDESFYYSLGKTKPFENNNCPATFCETTSDKTRLGEADLVVVSMTDGIPSIPKSRPETQRWVFTVIESPIHTRDYNEYNGVFNLTATYLQESDFANSYEYQNNFYWKLNKSFDENFDFFSEKKYGVVAGLISNCGAGTRRLDYINELKKYIPVKLFGACGEACPKVSQLTGKEANCKFIIGTEYKFFLAFENSICKDYITEKFFNMLSYNIIPVVLGGGNYSQFVPKSGYIDALDYDSPKKLAEHMNYLLKNKEAYNMYFKWKKHIWFHNLQAKYCTICSMCIQLELEEFHGIKKRTISDLSAYWSREKQCKIPQTQEKDGVLYYKVQ